MNRIPIMKLLIILLLVTFSLVSREVESAWFVCPLGEEGMQVQGPAIKKKMSGLNVITCSYSERRQVGEITVYKDYDATKPGNCDWGRHVDQDLVSEEHQAYAEFKDKKSADDYTEEFWKGLAREFLASVEENALMCDFEESRGIGILRGRDKMRKTVGKGLDIKPHRGKKKTVGMNWQITEKETAWPDAQEIKFICASCRDMGIPFSGMTMVSGDLGEYLQTLKNDTVDVVVEVKKAFLDQKETKGFEIISVGDLNRWQVYEIRYDE